MNGSSCWFGDSCADCNGYVDALKAHACLCDCHDPAITQAPCREIADKVIRPLKDRGLL